MKKSVDFFCQTSHAPYNRKEEALASPSCGKKVLIPSGHFAKTVYEARPFLSIFRLIL